MSVVLRLLTSNIADPHPHCPLNSHYTIYSTTTHTQTCFLSNHKQTTTSNMLPREGFVLLPQIPPLIYKYIYILITNTTTTTNYLLQYLMILFIFCISFSHSLSHIIL